MSVLGMFGGSFAAFAVLAAVCAFAVSLLLYLLRPPARRLVVPSVLIWERVLRGSKRPADRLRWWISLLLAATIASLMAIAALGPQAGVASAANSSTVVVLDNSPTMAARTTDGSTRFDQALAEGRRLIEALAAGDEVMVADTQRQIATPIFEVRDSALALLQNLRPGHDVQARIPEVAAVAPAGNRYVVSDGVLLQDLPPDAIPVSVFEPVENVGITAFELEMIPGDPRRYQAFMEFSNAGAADKPVVLDITGAGGQRITRQLLLPANSSITQLVDVSGFDGGPLRAALAVPGDALSIDDVAYGFLPMRRLIRLTLVTPGSEFLVKSLSAQPRVQLRVIAPSRYADRGDADLYVFDRFAPRNAPRAPAILFNPGNAAWLPASAGTVAEPQVSDWDITHPLLQNVSLRDLYIESAALLRPRADISQAVFLRARSSGPALALAHDAVPRWIWLGFDLEHSNFGLHAAFPAFLNNAIQWTVGESVLVRKRPGIVSIGLTGIRVFAMDGSEPPLSAFGEQSQFSADQPGIYTAVSADQRVRIAVNVLDRKVSEVNRSRLQPQAPLSRDSGGAPDLKLPFDGWTLLLLAALVLLMFEWLTYNRRLTV